MVAISVDVPVFICSQHITRSIFIKIFVEANIFTFDMSSFLHFMIFK